MQHTWNYVHYPLQRGDFIPAERKVVLVWVDDPESRCPYCGYVVYIKDINKEDRAYFVVERVETGDNNVVAWCDCLPDNGPDFPNARMYTQNQMTGRGFPAKTI